MRQKVQVVPCVIGCLLHAVPRSAASVRARSRHIAHANVNRARGTGAPATIPTARRRSSRIAERDDERSVQNVRHDRHGKGHF